MAKQRKELSFRERKVCLRKEDICGAQLVSFHIKGTIFNGINKIGYFVKFGLYAMVYGDRMKLLFLGRKVHFVKGRFGLRKEDLIYEKKVFLRKEDFVYEIKVLFSYIALHMHIFVTKWTNYEIIFLSTKGRFFFYERKVLSTKGRFYYRIYCSTYIYLLQN